ncbi:MAG: polysaccharide lyase [Polyangiaceae bacterium]|jgi:hypothetical protein
MTAPFARGLTLAIVLVGAVMTGCTPVARSRSSAASRVNASTDAQGGAPDCPKGRTPIWRGRFDDAKWLARWDPGARFIFGQNDLEVVSDARFGKALRVHYPAGSSSPSYAREKHPIGGAEFKVALPDGRGTSSIFLSYWLKFAPGFQWVRGGKLPGVCGGSCPSGGAYVSGEGGWSVRTMWRPEGAGEQYAYILPAHEYGTEIGLGAWTFTTGAWHRLAEEILLNTGDQSDGKCRVWFDVDPRAPPTFEAAGLSFRRDATGATTLFFSTFFGGHDASWATPVDTFVDFAEFVVCR